MNAVEGPVLLDTDEAAAYLTLTKKHLERLRWNGEGPMFLKFSGLVRYMVRDLDAWIESRRRHSTSDTGEHAV